MTSRERVLTTLDHREPDRAPWDFWAGAEVGERLRKHFACDTQEELLVALGVDLRYVRGPSYVGQEFRTYEDGTVEDLWGVRRETKHITHGPYRWKYKHVRVSPLADAESPDDIEAYGYWPSSDWWDYSSIAGDCEAARWDRQLACPGPVSGRGCHRRPDDGPRDASPPFAVVNAGDRLDRTAQLKPMMYLRGMEQTYLDLAWNPEIVDAIVGRIRGYFLEYNRRVFEAAHGARRDCLAHGIEIFMMGDDFGTQGGPMMSPDTWRRFFKEGFRQYIELAHRHGMTVMHHTCGSVVELIPDFIECGLDILQSLQPRAKGMDLAELKREFGRDLCFHGGVDIQQTLPAGTRDEIREMVRRLMDAGKPGGGFIISTAHNIPPETPTANVLALYDAYREFATY